MRRYSTLFVGLCALGLASSALAAPDVSVAVLGIEPIDVPESLAQQLTDALRQRAAATGGVRTVQGKDLIEVKMVFGCDGELPACMAQAGKTLGADKLLYGTVKKTARTSVTVTLKLLDVKTAVVEKFVNDTVPKREIAGANVNSAAARWFGQLLEVEAKPTLTVTSEPTGASVTVDGQSYGRTPLTLRDLLPGAHTLVLTMAGRLTATRTVDLRAGGAHDVAIALDAEAPAVAQKAPEKAPEPLPLISSSPSTSSSRLRSDHPGRTAKIVAGVLVGAAVVTTGVAIYTWRSYTDLETRTHADLEALKPPTVEMQDQSFFANPTCNGVPPAIAAGNQAGATKFTNDCNSGSNFAAITTGLWVATGALAAAGVVSFVIGDRQATKAKEHGMVGLLRQSLRVAPVFTTRGGGLNAKFEF